MNWSKTAQALKQIAPKVIAWTTGAGVLASAVLHARAGMKTEHTLVLARDVKGENLTTTEKIQMCWRHYILPGSVTAATLALIICGRIVDKRQRAALAAMYVGLSKTYKQYQNEVRREFGEETHQKILTRIGQEAEKTNLHGECFGEICGTAFTDDEEIRTFFDEWSGQYFQASPEQVYRAQLHLNRNFTLAGYATLAQWYEFLGIDPRKDTSGLVWTVEDELYWIDFVNSSVTTDDGFECLTVGFAWDPYPDPGYVY